MTGKRENSRLVFVLLVVSCLFNAQLVSAYMVGDDGEPVHEYIAERALYLYSSPEINTYFGQIQHGAEHEDLHDHVYDRSGACTTVTHFWDADKGPDDPVDSVVVCADGANAWQKAQVLWGMALGEYASGDKDSAYEYLGHIVHLLSDMSVPAHVHEDVHYPDDDCYEDWMTLSHAQLSPSEIDLLNSQGPLEIPSGTPDPLFYLFYTTNQVADFFPSDDYDGDSYDNPSWGGWMHDIYYYEYGNMYDITSPRTHGDLSDNDYGDNDDDGDLSVIRNYSFRNSIRAVAALYKLFDETVSQNNVLTVVVDRIKAQDVHDEPGGDADFFVKIAINGFWFINEGNQVVDEQDISPGWAFARYAGISGTANIVIQVWDEDEAPNPDDKSDIDPGEGRDLDLVVDLSTGAVTGDISGTCDVTLTSVGSDDDYSQIWFRILLPNIPPIVTMGPDKTSSEGSTVYVSGSFTDPNIEDTHLAAWKWGDSSPIESGQVIESGGIGTILGEHVYADNGVYTVELTVVDDKGAESSGTLTVTVNNVSPSVSAGPDREIYSGETANVDGSFSDPGWLDTHTASWNWGDGMVTSGTVSEENIEPDSTGTVTGSHKYYEADDYAVSLTVTDNDAGSDTDSMIVTVKRIPVPIDIMPGGYPNAINLKKKGLVAVALLNDPTWTPIYIEPTMIDPATVKFMGANPIRWTLEDVDSDGDMDLLLHYKTRETTICVGDTDACIFGDLYDQRQIEGVDSIKTP